jgi:hypothetical protein
MVNMKTLDHDYLASHPAGDQLAEFNVSIPLPESVDVPNNPDGTRPKVSMKATSDTYGNLLGALSYIHDEDVSANILALVLANVDEEKFEAFENAEDAIPFMREAAAEIVTPFRTFSVEFTLEADGEETPVSVALELTAPNMVTAAQALTTMTKPRVLTELAISISPETEDDDEYDEYAGDSRNEVLVVS